MEETTDGDVVKVSDEKNGGNVECRGLSFTFLRKRLRVRRTR